ncbi:MAG: LamG domain-containing protein, partial [Candidatus Pacebacteria bacterium]|nr:LamG domain-containing protein [Candidatus Paceibacterota bacterium]
GTGQIVYDYGTSSTNGTLGGASTASSNDPVWTSSGKIGGALQFDGKDDYVDAGNDPSLSMGTSDWTVEGWVKKPSNTPVGTMVACRDTATGRGPGFHSLVNGTDGKIYLYFSDTDDTYRINMNSNARVDDDVWHHFAFTFDRNANMSIYIDGIFDNATTISSQQGSVSNSSNFYFGASASGGVLGSFLNGFIDDVRIYNYARTAAQVKKDYSEIYRTKYVSGAPSFNGGSQGSALQFDGVDDFASIPNSATVAVDSNLTVEAWIKPSGSGTRTFISKRNAAPSYYDYGMWVQSSSYLRFLVQTNVTYVGITSDNVLTMGNWYHVVGTYDGSRLKLYINGVLQSNTPGLSGNITKGGNSLIIGAWIPYNETFNGSIDEIRIYNRDLSPEEVRYHYNRGGPVAHWKFDEGSGTTTYDETNNNNDGQFLTAASSPTWVKGKFGSALLFDGENDYVSLGTTSDLNFTNNFSISAWIHLKTFGDAGYGRIFSRRQDIPASGYIFIVNDDTNALQFSGIGGSNVTSATNSIQLNVWQHVAMSMSNGTVALYVNGVNQGSGTTTITGVSSLLAVIGDESNDSGSRNFNGLMDDIRIYNYARTQEQILQDYNGGLSAHLK